jgi:hypothetical protein
VPEPTGGGAHVDAVEQHPGCCEVAQVVQADAVHALLSGEPAERERHVAGAPRGSPGGVVAEDEPAVRRPYTSVDMGEHVDGEAGVRRHQVGFGLERDQRAVCADGRVQTAE